MAAELEIRFTGDDPEQQAAFDNPQTPAIVPAESPNVPAVVPSVQPQLPPGDNQAVSAQPVQPRSESTDSDRDWTTEELLREIHDILNTDTLNTLKDISTSLYEINMREAGIEPQQNSPSTPGQPPAPSEGKTDESGSFIDRVLSKFDATINKTLETLGVRDTRAGRTVSSISQSIVKRGTNATKRAKNFGKVIGRTRIGRAAKAFGGRVANTRAGKAVASVGRAVATRLGLTAAATGAGQAGGAGAAVAAALGPVGAAAAITSAAFVGAALTVKALSDAVHGLANEIEDLSPAVAYARAQAEVNQTLNRLDRADRIGPEVARLEAARYRLDESMYEVQTKIYEYMLTFGPYLEVIIDGIKTGVDTAKDWGPSVGNVLRGIVLGDLTGAIVSQSDAMAKNLLEEQKKSLGKSREEEDLEDPWSRLFGDFDAPNYPPSLPPSTPSFHDSEGIKL